MEVINEVDLSPFSTMGVWATAKKFGIIRQISDWDYLITNKQIPSLILGGGSNVLFIHENQDFVVKNEIVGKKIIQEDENHITIEVGSGEIWHDFVMWTLKKGYGGLENLALIPGTAGAAPIQNIGAYGVEQKDCFIALTYIDLTTGKRHELSKKNCQFAYRNSIFKHQLKGKAAILSVRYQLTKKKHCIRIDHGGLAQELQGEATPENIAHTVIKIRQQKLPDPKKLGNAGSFFKNPLVTNQHFKTLVEQYPSIPHFKQDEMVKIPAAWLIESCGWKGHRCNDIGVSPNHALILVNYGKGTGKEIKKLAEKIIQSVKEKFAIELVPEVSFV